MTDMRYPERWLNDKRVLLLSDAAHRLFVTGYAWAVSNRTNGVILGDDLVLMPRVDSFCAEELVAAGLWAYDGERWFLVDFDATQTSAAQLAAADAARKREREKKARQRARRKAEERGLSPGDVPGDNTGQDRLGQARTGTEGEGVPEWPTTAVPGGLNGAHRD